MTRTAVRASLVLIGTAGLVGCAAGHASPLPTGQAAYAALGDNSVWPDENLIRVGDHLSIRVLGEPELSSEAYVVDANGNLQVPLAGEMQAAGQSPSQLQKELVARLGRSYIRDPQVAVIVTERRRTTFSVEGSVREPGAFEAVPNTTLLSAIAQPKSPTDTAQLDQVMVFRVANGQRMGARFNLKEIRNGRAPDPQILAGDTIVVGGSGLKEAWKQFLQAAPAFNLFYIFR